MLKVICCNGGCIVWPKYLAISRFDPKKSISSHCVVIAVIIKIVFGPISESLDVVPIFWWQFIEEICCKHPKIFSVSTVCPVSQHWAGVSVFTTLYRNEERRKCWWWKTLLSAWLAVSERQPESCVLRIWCGRNSIQLFWWWTKPH